MFFCAKNAWTSLVLSGIWPALSPQWASLVAQRLKRLPAMWETWVQSLGCKDSLEKEMATHPSIFAWRIPWTEEPGGLQSMGSQRVGHDWMTAFTFKHSMEKAIAPHSSTLAGKSHGQRSLVGCSLWGCEESDRTEQLHFHFALWWIGEGNGSTLQCSCLENPRDGGAS